MSLVDDLQTSPAAAASEVEKYFQSAVRRYNSETGPRILGRVTTEKLPTAKRDLSSFRSRLGALIEYAVGSLLDEMFVQDFGNDLSLAFVHANQYPDYYIRNADGEPLLSIDAKGLHEESEEFSARLTVPVAQLTKRDFVLYFAWQWDTTKVGSSSRIYPRVYDDLVLVSASEIAQERDRRHMMGVGNSFGPAGEPLLGSGNIDTNFGKINRIVHPSRRDAPDLAPDVRRFLEFTQRQAAVVPKIDIP
jgi:hypothetical protein